MWRSRVDFPTAAGARKAAGPRIVLRRRASLAKYPHLKETPLADPAQRTEWNVRDADACLILVDAGGVEVSAGTMLAGDLAHRYRKPLLVVDLREPDILERAAPWLRAQQYQAFGAGFMLAIGGPRESEAPGIYKRASRFIGALLDAKSALLT